MVRKRKNAQNKKSRTTENFERFKEELVNSISHELKTPLTMLLCALELAKHAYEENDVEEFNKLILIAKRSAEKQKEIVENFCRDISLKKAKCSDIDLGFIQEIQ